MIQNLFYLIILIASFPVAFLLAYLCKEEIKAWRKRFLIISIICFILSILVSFIPNSFFQYKLPVTITLFFVIIMNLTVIWRSYYKKKK